MKCFVFILFGFLISCTTISKVTPNFANSEEDRMFQAVTLENKNAHYAEALLGAEQFQTKFPYSVKLQKMRFQKAQALEGLGRWQEAADTYIAISNFSKKSQPEIAALSVYRLSYVYEALGDNQRVLTSLFDAQRLAEYLPAEIGMAEIPARLAAAYMKENNPEEAQRWLQEADQGLQRALSSRTEPTNAEWLAKTYYNMGSVSTSQLTQENVLTVIQGQQAIQKYLIKALQYNDPIWSAKAAEKLKETFSAIWMAIDEKPDESGQEPIVAAKIKKDEQFKLAGPFVDLIEQILETKPGVDQGLNSYQRDVYNYLEDLKLQVGQLLKEPIYTPLIRKSDKGSPKSAPADKVLKTEDPN